MLNGGVRNVSKKWLDKKEKIEGGCDPQKYYHMQLHDLM